MDNKTIKETLEKQLQLLSERSQNPFPDDNLAALTEAMIKVVGILHKDCGNCIRGYDVMMQDKPKEDEACSQVNVARPIG